MNKIITRFPPSPTGFLHIGGVRTALFNYLFAARYGGVMHLRFEDTDRERSKPEFEADILEGLNWLRIPYERALVMRQSQRTDVYKRYLPQLISGDFAYEAEESKEDPSKKVIRFKNPNKDVTFNDLIRGPITFNTAELGDFVIARNIDSALYHLAVVIDDFETGVTHVIRGEDHISNTQRQMLIIEALGFPVPQYGHIPLILAPDRTKLSKRHGAVSVNEYRSQGFIPEALVNYLALLGWHPDHEQEIFTIDELVEQFDLSRVQKGGAIFDITKLNWINQEHLRRLSGTEYSVRLREYLSSQGNTPPEYLESISGLLQERSETLADAATLIRDGEFGFMDDLILSDADLLVRGAAADSSTVVAHLKQLLVLIENLDMESWNAEQIKAAVFPYAENAGKAAVLWPMRVALSGRPKSPDPFTIAGLIGKEKTLDRIALAMQKLQDPSSKSETSSST